MSPLSSLSAYALSAVTAITSLLVTQGLISNAWERTISGIASVVIPAAFLVVNAWHAHSQAKVKAAQATAVAAAAGRVGP